jgi:hypothetical protein
MVFCIIGLLSMGALVIDMGALYFSHQQLVAATDAAALAGGAAIPAGNGTSVAAQYSAASGDLNNHPNLQSVTVTSTLKCLTSTGLGLPPCSIYGSQTAANAIQVTATATVNTFFARVFGVKSVTMTATATASAKGGSGGPYNVMLVLDTTASMNTVDTYCNRLTQEQCALGGIRTLLGELDPCAASLASCPAATGGNVPNPVDDVGLIVFPGLTPTHTSTLDNPPIAAPTASKDYTCPTSNPSITSYNNNPGYLILPFQSDYRTSDAAAALNASSAMVIAAGGGTCQGVQAPGGEGTFYAGAIAAAQRYLVANERPNAQNVMVILSDGDATASSAQMAGTATNYPASQECSQAVTAANNAKNAGILIYSISYASKTSGCTSDTNPTITPCQTMSNIASTPLSTYFFSNASSQTGTTVCAGGRPNSGLSSVFTQIAADLTVARLIPNNTT